MMQKFYRWLRDWADAKVARPVAEVGPTPVAAVEVAVPAAAPRPRRPLRLRVSASQLAADWERDRDPEFQREAKALLAEKMQRAAARKKKEKPHGNDHQKR